MTQPVLQEYRKTYSVLMSTKPFSVDSYPFKPTDSFLLDANVWLRIYGPQGDPRDPIVRSYSSALQRLLTTKSRIVIDAIVLSEFINRNVRLRHGLIRGLLGVEDDFKRFRASRQFWPIARDVSNDVRRIVRHCNQIETNFVTVDLNAVMSDFEKGKLDFNDRLILGLCESENLGLVTHDRDFRGENIKILTANPKLL